LYHIVFIKVHITGTHIAPL